MRRVWALPCLAAITVACVLVALKSGSVPVSWSQLWSLLTDPNARQGDVAQIVLQLRLPRVVLALLVGGALALSGTAFQALLRNPLADPYIVGTSAGAAVGAAASVMLATVGINLDKPLLAFVGALMAMLAVYRIAWTGGRLPVETFLLAGVVIGAFLWAIVSLLLFLSKDQMSEIVFWLMGDLTTASFDHVAMVAPYLALGAVVLMLLAHPLNLLTLGEEMAFHLGVRVEPFKLAVVTVASLLTAAAVSVSGLIGFVGLVVPHLTRRLTGADHRILLPGAALAGASFLLLADTLSRCAWPDRELPVGVVTALLGGPFFLALLMRRRRGAL